MRRFLRKMLCVFGRHDYRIHYCELCLPDTLHPVEHSRFWECGRCGHMQRRTRCPHPR